MEFTSCCRVEFAAPVIETECHIRRLLNLSNKETTISSMHCTWSYINRVTWLRMNLIHDLTYCTVLTSVIELLGRHLAVKTGIYDCTWLCIHHIPDLSLTKLVISFSCDCIIWMHLHRKFIIDIKELDQKWELTSIIIIHLLAYDSLEVSLHNLSDGVTCKPAILDNRIFDSHIS